LTANPPPTAISWRFEYTHAPPSHLVRALYQNAAPAAA
jgi:hypothetical protein